MISGWLLLDLWGQAHVLGSSGPGGNGYLAQPCFCAVKEITGRTV